MKQIAIAAFISLGVLAFLAVGGFLLIQKGSSSEEETRIPIISATGKSAPQQANGDVPQEEFAGSSNRRAILSDGMSNYDVQLYIHEMTHNKVYADIKFGSRPLTGESIARLIEIVEKNSYSDEKFFLETLDAWQDGNFSNAVEVHNTIWNWHSGTVGKAERLMTPEEEQNYIDMMF